MKNSYREEKKDKDEMQESGRMMRSSLKEGGILKAKEENSNPGKEKQRSNSKVSFFIDENNDKKLEERKSKAKLSLISENEKNELKENKVSKEKNSDAEITMNEEAYIIKFI